MKKILLILLILGFVVEIVVLFGIIRQRRQEKVLGEQVLLAPSPEPSPSDSPTLSSTASPTVRPTPKISPTPSPTPQPTFTSQQINSFIDNVAGQYGLDPNVLRHLAVCESGFNPMAQHSGYVGLFQFGSTTWKNIRLEMNKDTDLDLRLNAKEAVETAGYVFHINKTYIWPNCMP